jgi:hypothetical protein
MRRLLGLAVLFVVLSVCVPSYGNYFLIYNLSGTVKGVNVVAKATIPWNAYLVLNLNEANEITDANLIMYGKDDAKQKVYVTINYHNSDVWLNVSLLAHGNFSVLNFYVDEDWPFNFHGYMLGEKKGTNIGLANKKNTAGSLKGVMWVWEWMLFDVDNDLAGTAAISASLNSLTKAVNDTNPTWTQNQIIEGQLINGKTRGIKPDLEAKGYVDVSPY